MVPSPVRPVLEYNQNMLDHVVQVPGGNRVIRVETVHYEFNEDLWSSHSVSLMVSVFCFQTLGRRAASQWRTCQLIRWPKLCRRWFSPNLNPPPPHLLDVVHVRLICKCVAVNKYDDY